MKTQKRLVPEDTASGVADFTDPVKLVNPRSQFAQPEKNLVAPCYLSLLQLGVLMALKHGHYRQPK